MVSNNRLDGWRSIGDRDNEEQLQVSLAAVREMLVDLTDHLSKLRVDCIGNNYIEQLTPIVVLEEELKQYLGALE